MEFSKDLVKVSCEAMLQRNSAPSLGATSWALISPSKTLAFQTHDRNPVFSSFHLHASSILGWKPFLEKHSMSSKMTLSIFLCNKSLYLNPAEYSFSTYIFGTSGMWLCPEMLTSGPLKSHRRILVHKSTIF